MGWSEDDDGDDKKPRTEFVRMPSPKASQPPPPREDAGQTPAQPAWSPRATQGSPPPPPSDAPFGGYHSTGQTAVMRRESSRARMVGVLLIGVVVLALAAGAIFLAIGPIGDAPEAPPVGDAKDKVVTDPEPPPNTDKEPVDTASLVPDAPEAGGKTTGGKTTGGKATGGKTTGGKTTGGSTSGTRVGSGRPGTKSTGSSSSSR